jgi:riboflavin kinase/FMN adenylyltransferase
MKVIYGLNQIRRFRRAVVALGVFDGVHWGHRRILESAVDKAKRIKGRSIVITFWPDPHREESLYSLERRLRLIESIGIEVCIVINFNKKFSIIPAEDFVKNILVNKLKAEYIYVGANFRFGRDKEGSCEILKKLSRIYNFKLKVFDIVRRNNLAISSTYIRKLIREGNFKVAQELLTRPASILGRVVKGSSLGKVLGFPTANITPQHEALPSPGVYAVKVILNKNILSGVCYIGNKPTFTSKKYQPICRQIKNIEVHIFSFYKNIYAKEIEIQFIKKIRQEKKFASSLSLVNQIKKDLIQVKKLFSRHQPYPKI